MIASNCDRWPAVRTTTCGLRADTPRWHDDIPLSLNMINDRDTVPDRPPRTGAPRRSRRHDRLNPMATPPESTETSLRQRLAAHAAERWPQLAAVHVRYHGAFAYITGELADGTRLPLMRLRYTGYATTWGFAIYLASRDGYHNSILPNGRPAGTRRNTRLRLRPLPQRPHRLATPDEQTGAPTRRAGPTGYAVRGTCRP